MVHRAITYEAQRQIDVLNEGGVIKQQTRKWDDNHNKSLTMRSKEEAQDYRYFPDPDILSVAIGQDIVENIRKEIPRLAPERQVYYVETLGLPEYDSKILTSEYYISQYFEECLKGFDNPKVVSNWVMTEVLRKLKEKPSEDLNDVISSSNLVDIMTMVEDKTITRVNGKELFEMVAFSDKDARKTAKESGMIVTFDADSLTKTIEEVFTQNAKAVPDYKDEPEKVMNFFIGQTMRATKGTAKIDFIKPIIIKKLEELNK
jgi:aspartyl-tRNA(Asn)/glutamyl-tRNA(Gln) amidotransferase subunit B